MKCYSSLLGFVCLLAVSTLLSECDSSGPAPSDTGNEAITPAPPLPEEETPPLREEETSPPSEVEPTQDISSVPPPPPPNPVVIPFLTFEQAVMESFAANAAAIPNIVNAIGFRVGRYNPDFGLHTEHVRDFLVMRIDPLNPVGSMVVTSEKQCDGCLADIFCPKAHDHFFVDINTINNRRVIVLNIHLFTDDLGFYHAWVTFPGAQSDNPFNLCVSTIMRDKEAALQVIFLYATLQSFNLFYQRFETAAAENLQGVGAVVAENAEVIAVTVVSAVVIAGIIADDASGVGVADDYLIPAIPVAVRGAITALAFALFPGVKAEVQSAATDLVNLSRPPPQEDPPPPPESNALVTVHISWDATVASGDPVNSFGHNPNSGTYSIGVDYLGQYAPEQLMVEVAPDIPACYIINVLVPPTNPSFRTFVVWLDDCSGEWLETGFTVVIRSG